MKTTKKPTQRKVTMMLPEELLESALKASGETMTETVRQGLELIAASQTYSSLRALRGKVKLDINVKELRRDRNW
jgi:hypothetical protein